MTDGDVVAPSGAHEGPAVAIFVSRDLDRSQRFYESLGFVTDLVQPDYLLMWRGETMLHVAQVPSFDPLTQNSCAALVVTDDVDAVHAQFAATGIWVLDEACDADALAAELQRRSDAGESLARVGVVQDEPWGIREFALRDDDNNLLRYGTFLATV